MSNLPIAQNQFLQELNLVIPEPITHSDTASLSQVKKADIELFNTQLRILHALWAKVETLPAALVLIKQTLEMPKLRRDILGLQYGAPTNKFAEPVTYEPIP